MASGVLGAVRSFFSGAGNYAAFSASGSTGTDFTRGLSRDPAWVRQLAIPGPDANVPDDERIGGPGTIVRFGRIQHEEFNPDLENENGIGDGLGIQGIYDKMRKTDPQARRSLQLLKLPLLCATPKIEPGEDTDLAREIAQYVSYNLFELNRWQDILRQTLLFYDFGFSTFEILRGLIDVPRARFPNLPHAKGPGRPGAGEMVKAFGFTDIAFRHPKTIYQWAAKPDRPTELAFIVQRLATTDTDAQSYRAIPADRLLRFTHDQEAANFAGTSVLRAAYKPWKIKETLETIDAIRHERQNVGIATLTCPDNPDKGDIDKLEKVLGKIGSWQGAFMTLPNGYVFKFETSGTGEGTKVNESIDRCVREIADNVCAGFMTLGNGDTGSYAMADTQRDSGFFDSVEAGGRLIETGWNHGYDGKSFIKELVDEAYGPQTYYPRLLITNLKRGELELLSKLMATGGVTSDVKLRNYIRAKLNLPAEGEVETRREDDPQDEKRSADEVFQKTTETAPGKTPEQVVPGDPNNTVKVTVTAPTPAAPAKPPAGGNA